jgi:hypothetical protein
MAGQTSGIIQSLCQDVTIPTCTEEIMVGIKCQPSSLLVMPKLLTHGEISMEAITCGIA